MAEPRQARLAGIEAGRGVAAMLVVAVHAGDHLRQAYGAFAAARLTMFGHAGVDFFFVLSGFIILHVHREDIGRPGRLSHYLRRRVSRIYPFYWVVLAASLALEMVTRGAATPSAGRLVAELSLWPTRWPLTVDVAWTLQFELVFYACFAAVVLHPLAGLALFAMWLGCIGAGLAAGAQGGLGLAALLGSYFGLEFFIGMLAAWLVARGTTRRPGLWLALGAVWFLATGACETTGMFEPTRFLPHLSYALASMLMVVGLAGGERAGWLAVPRALQVLGGATYAIYLTHELTIGALWQVALKTGLDRWAPPALLLVLLMAGAAMVGVAASRLVERPLIGLARALLEWRRPDWPWQVRASGR